MRVSIQKLIEAIEPISFLVSKTKIPILANVKISSQGNGIFAEATNLETFVRIKLYKYQVDDYEKTPVDCVLVNVKDLKDIIALYKDSGATYIDIYSEGSKAIFETNISSTFTLKNEDELCFVDITVPDFELKYTAPMYAFMHGLKKALNFTPPPNSNNHNMKNISLESEDEGKLSIVGTDGCRFARISVYSGLGELDHRISEEATKFLLKCNKLFDGNRMRIFSSKGKLHFENDNSERIHVFTTVSDELFPNWKAIIPSKDKFHVRLFSDEMIKRMKRLKAKTKNASPQFYIDFADGDIAFTSNDPFGSLKEIPDRFKIMSANGTIKTAYNPDFFIDAINATEQNEFDFKIYEDSNIASIEGSDFYSLIMPIRIE